jgi:hypothetical protein
MGPGTQLINLLHIGDQDPVSTLLIAPSDTGTNYVSLHLDRVTDSYQGSTFVFQSYIAPYFTKNEVALDKAIADAQASTGTFLQSKVGSLWEMVLGLMNKSNNSRAQQSGAPGGAAASPNRPGQPGGGQVQGQQPPSAVPLMQAAAGLWAAYGPAVMGAMNRNSQAAPAPAGNANISSASQSTSAARPESSQSRRSSQGPASPTMNRGQSSGYQARSDPRQVPLPPSSE